VCKEDGDGDLMWSNPEESKQVSHSWNKGTRVWKGKTWSNTKSLEDRLSMKFVKLAGVLSRIKQSSESIEW